MVACVRLKVRRKFARVPAEHIYETAPQAMPHNKGLEVGGEDLKLDDGVAQQALVNTDRAYFKKYRRFEKDFLKGRTSSPTENTFWTTPRGCPFNFEASCYFLRFKMVEDASRLLKCSARVHVVAMFKRAYRVTFRKSVPQIWCDKVGCRCCIVARLTLLLETTHLFKLVFSC